MMSSSKMNALAATALLVLSLLPSNYCRAGNPPIDPKLVSVYKRMVAYEDGVPKPDRHETPADRDIEIDGYTSGNSKLAFSMWREFVALLPDVHSDNPDIISKRRKMVFALQKQFGATTTSIVLMLPDSKALFEYSKNANIEEHEYVRRHPSLRLTELARYTMFPYRKHRSK